MGLTQNGPNSNNIIADAYKVWSKIFDSSEDIGPNTSEQIERPGFETENSQEEAQSCTHVPNSIPDTPLLFSNEPSDGESESENDGEYDEAEATRKVGKSIGLSVEQDGDVIQAIYEDHKEWKKGKKRKGKKKRRSSSRRKRVQDEVGESKCSI